MSVIHLAVRSAYFFLSERNRLHQSLEYPMDEQYLCLFYGLWTHSSSVVVHLVVSSEEELKIAEAHDLNLLGYAAIKYTQANDSWIRSQFSSTTSRETIIIDVDKMKKDEPWCVLASRPWVDLDVGNGQEGLIKCEVKILHRESPFRKLIERQQLLSPTDIESETESNIHSNAESDRFRQESREIFDLGESLEPISTLGIVKSLRYRIKVDLVDDNSEISEENKMSSIQFRFIHHGNQWKIKLTIDEVSEHDLLAKIFYKTVDGSQAWKRANCSEKLPLSKDVVAAVKATCSHCQREIPAEATELRQISNS